MQKYNSRNEVPEKYKWDLTPFFKDDKAFEESFSKTKKLISELKSYVGCTKDANKLYEFLKKEYEAVALYEDLYVYAYLVNDQELGVSESIARKGKTEQLDVDLVNNTSFLAPELLTLTKEEYDNLYKKCKELEEFKAALDKLYRRKEHILSESEEIIVSELVNAMNHFDDMSSNLLNKEHDYGKVKLDDGEVVTIATNNYRRIMKNKNVDIRKKVYKQFNKKLEQYSGTNAMYLNSYVSMCDKLAKIYKFEDSWQSRLFDLNLSDKVFKSLVSTVENNAKSMQRYYNLKKQVLGLKELHSYDLNLKLGKSESGKSDKEYSIEEAQSLIREALKPLGEEYLSKFDKIIENRYIDYCQYKGKCSGGYSFSTMLQDSRILMSFNYNLDSVSTIAHEGGHNVHHQFVNTNNPIQYREPGSVVAEVASLTNECLLSNYLANKGKTKKEKLAGLANIIGVIVSNLFGAVREGKLEQEMYEEVHNGGVLTKEFLNKKTRDSLKKYYGSVVKMDKYTGNGWITRSHYYMHFYLYSYAICISVASNVASKILDGDKEMLENYLKFLKTGSDKWPSEAFAILGIDLEDSKVYENAIKYFDSLIDKYYEILEEDEVK